MVIFRNMTYTFNNLTDNLIWYSHTVDINVKEKKIIKRRKTKKKNWRQPSEQGGQGDDPGEDTGEGRQRDSAALGQGWFRATRSTVHPRQSPRCQRALQMWLLQGRHLHGFTTRRRECLIWRATHSVYIHIYIYKNTWNYTERGPQKKKGQDWKFHV